jgi:alpha-tubulin suppressor-like RCC1 family protein
VIDVRAWYPPADDEVRLGYSGQVRRIGFVLLLAGCYEAPVQLCTIRCTTSCPDGLTCNASGLCEGPDGCQGPQLDVATIAVGSRHTCVLDTTGAISCWGANDVGQLGLGGGVTGPVPIASRVGDPADVWTALAVGSEHACGLKGGVALCWGQNRDGQAVAGRGGNILVPTAVMFASTAPPPAFDQIAAGGAQTCAVGSGQLWCWGATDLVGSDVSVGTQIRPDIIDWVGVSAGFDHTCATSTSAGVLCWGENDSGQCGQPESPATIALPTPVAMPGGLPVIVALDAGQVITCAILSAAAPAQGQLWCWGDNSNHVIQMIDGNPSTPTQVGTDADWTSISARGSYVCGARSGMAYCWGSTQGGQLGDGLWSSFREPYAPDAPIAAGDAVDIGFDAKNFAPTATTSCLLSQGHASCWGDNTFGGLGLGSVSLHRTPVEIHAPGGHAWTHVWSGRVHTCATTDDGALWCWGDDGKGEISANVARGIDQPCLAGLPCDAAIPTAAPVGAPDAVVVGSEYTCTLAAGKVHCWGTDVRNVLGVPNPNGHAVTNVAGDWDSISGGDRGLCGFSTGSRVPSCWGDVASIPTDTPTVLAGAEVHDIAQASFGDDFGCLTRSLDMVRVCWGADGNNELGDNNTVDVPAPTAMTDLVVTSVVAAGAHACALTAATGVMCWGSNGHGESGVPNQAHVPVPNPIADASGPLTGCTGLALSDAISCAVCGGTVECWGFDNEGELGDGDDPQTPNGTASPIAVSGHTFAEVAARSDGGCALTTDAHLFCWGDSTHGEVGDGSHSANVPTPVGGN